jgi:hypothetical protein
MPTTTASTKDAGPLPWLTWPFSLLLPLALILFALSLVVGGDDQVVELTVRDEAGNPLPETHVMASNAVYLTDSEGKVRLEVGDSPEDVTIQREGFTTMVGTIDKHSDAGMPITLQTNTIAQAQPSGTLGTATLSAQVSTPADEGSDQSSTPQPPVEASKTAGQEVAGVVTDANGDPVAQAWITDGETYAFTDSSGAFIFDPGAVAPDATLSVFGSGYHQVEVQLPGDGQPIEVALELQMIRGIYYNPNVSTTQEDVDRLINIANTTEVNAIVVDIKEELIFYDSQVQFFRDGGTVSPILDLPALLKQLQDNNIYTIARLVVFKDSAIAEKYPHLAVKDNVTGDLWRDMNGIAWVNPMLHELWDHNIELAHEAATLGFDEIQYDYVRFPTDGDTSRVAYGLENSQENRQNAIEGFLKRSRERLLPTGARLSADIFGYTVVVQDDLGIGQNLDRLAPHVDYLSPMIYPSHWPEGSLAVDGHPNNFPYETVDISMGLAKQQLDGNGRKLRPWLQDFNMPGMMEYGAAEVRAQIDATENLGLSGWLIWDPNNWYHVDAFKPESQPTPSPQATPVATPQSVSGGYGGAKGRRRR